MLRSFFLRSRTLISSSMSLSISSIISFSLCFSVCYSIVSLYTFSSTLLIFLSTLDFQLFISSVSVSTLIYSYLICYNLVLSYSCLVSLNYLYSSFCCCLILATLLIDLCISSLNSCHLSAFMSSCDRVFSSSCLIQYSLASISLRVYLIFISKASALS